MLVGVAVYCNSEFDERELVVLLVCLCLLNATPCSLCVWIHFCMNGYILYVLNRTFYFNKDTINKAARERDLSSLIFPLPNL